MSQKVSDILDFLETSSDKIKGAMIDNTTNIACADINFTSGTMRGHILPDTTNTYDIGSAEKKVRDMYVDDSTIYMGDHATIKAEGTTIVVQDFKTSDMTLDNTHRDGNSVDGTSGSWTFQEGEDDLFLLNNVSGKRYKVNLTEV